ncbi:MAG TPA: LacI family DNA-binding transcriptional regulator [Candidatus Limnocylindria bacterium]|nr:LacI family DNA-binding transcriptional regulator [Candidatus Limnocylindria bacterium]
MAARNPRIYDVARSAGVSIATVSRVANGTAHVGAGTQARVRAAMETLGYRPHALARGLAARRSNTIGLLITDILDPYFAEIVRGAQERAESAGYAVLLGDASVRTATEDLLVKRLLERRVDGLIVASSRTTDEYAAQLKSEDIPVVCINGPIGQFAHAVQIDHRAGARLAIRHLAGLGHRRIAHITGPAGVPTRKERLGSYRAALKEVGLDHDPALVGAGVATIEESAAATTRLLAAPDPPTAIFAYNDRFAIGCYRAIRAAGLRVGADVSIVGFDDIVMTEWVDPPLTSVSQPRNEMGRIAIDLLLAVLTGRSAPELVVVQPQLVVRGSTGPLSRGAREERP